VKRRAVRAFAAASAACDRSRTVMPS
jgi:hypothetical protein